MQITRINSAKTELLFNTGNSQQISSKNTDNSKNITVLPSYEVAFTALAKITPATKMKMYAEKILNNLHENQKVHITADAKYLPFMNILSETAYKKGSGKVQYKIIEPEFEALKSKYNITESFDFEQAEKEALKKENAIFLNFSDKNNPYKFSGLTPLEEAKEIEKVKSIIPQKVYDKFKINPEEIFKEGLDLKKGQSVVILAEREHIPFITKLMDYLYSKNNTKLIKVHISEDEKVSMLKYAKNEVLDEFPTFAKLANEEYLAKDTAYLNLNAGFQNSMEGVDTDRLNYLNKTRAKALAESSNARFAETPWLIYYVPTTKTCISAYPELKENPVKAIEQAYIDANKINRIGALKEHREALIHRTNKMNELAKQGFRKYHYISYDLKTGKPDGKTDFQIEISPKSKFMGPLLEYKKNNHSTIPNIPTEESFSAPVANSAEGIISVTKPLLVNNKLVKGIVLKFKNGKVVDVKADENAEILRKYIQSNENANRLGEVAFVADSPIAKTGRFFNTTLVDENATCHLALGNAYGDCIEGIDNCKSFKEAQKYLKALNINSSPIHKDFMVGGDNVKITAINPETGETKTIIENDKFQL